MRLFNDSRHSEKVIFSPPFSNLFSPNSNPFLLNSNIAETAMV